MTVLDQVRVLELSSSIAAAYCARQFTLWGAEVMALPAGRSAPPPPTEGPSLLHEHVHAGKRFLAASDVTAELVAGADLVITDLSETELTGKIPSVADWPVVVAFSPYGPAGPYAGYAATELTVEAMCGFLSINGERDQPPLRMPGNMIGYICGVAGFVGALAALRRRDVSGVVERIDVSWMEALTTIVPVLRTQLDGRADPRDGGPVTGRTSVRQYRVGNGYLSTNFGLPKSIEVFLDIIGLSEADLPERLRWRGEDRLDLAKLREYIASLDSPFSVRELFQILSSPPYLAILGCVQTPPDLLDDPQLAAVNHFRKATLPDGREVVHAGAPARLHRCNAVVPRSPLDASGPEAKWAPRKEQPGQFITLAKPLADVRILDLTQAWIGPYASQLLADLGADVIKVESLEKPDVWRRLPPTLSPGVINPEARVENCSANFNSVNRDTKSLTLDLANPEGRRLFLELVRDADIVMENYTSGVMKRLGVDYAALSAVNNRVIMVSFSGYGNEGPYAEFRANGTTIEAVAGWDSLFGYAGGPPLVMGWYQADAITGLQMAATTLLALEHRRRTGEGQWVQGSMLEAAIGYIGEQVMAASLGMATGRIGNRHPDMAPHGVYRCSGTDDWVAIAARDDADYARLREVVGPDLPGGEFLSLECRLARQEELDAIISAWTRERDRRQITETLQARGVPAAPVQRTDEILEDRHLAARGWFQVLPHPDIGTRKYHGTPWRFSASDLRETAASPRLGQHNRELMRSLLALTPEQIDALYSAGIAGEVK